MRQVLPLDAAARTALDDLLQNGLARNPTIQSMEARIAQAQGIHLQSSLRPNPSLDLGVEADAETGTGSDRGFSVGYSHLFETAGKRRRRMDVAREEITIAEFELAESRRSIAGQIREGFLQVLVLSETIAGQQATADITNSLVEVVNQRVQQGEAPAIQLNQSRVERSRVVAELGLLQSRRNALLEAIRTSAGLDAGTPLRIEGAIELRQLTLPSDVLLAQALKLRPDLNIARTELRRIEADIELLKSQRVPNITAFLRYSYQRSGFDLNGLGPQGSLAPIRDLDHALSGGISFDIPVRDRNQGRLAAALAQIQSVRLHVRALEASIRQEVAVAYERYSSALNSLEIFQDEVLEQARASIDALRKAYQLGEISFSEVLNEQRRLFELQRAYNDTLLEYATAAADLARVAAVSLP